MNIQLGENGINWTDATWNPVTGCLHDCPYCYARAFAHRLHRSFEPAYHPERLSEPLARKVPTKIFVGSNADLFGDWVPAKWVRDVLDIVRRCPQHTFQFLTKAPHNLVKYNPWPDNCWVGATATDQAMMDNAVFCLSLVRAPVRFVSAEPLLGPIRADLSPLDWVIIGAKTGKRPQQPRPQWVADLVSDARTGGAAVWYKDNLTADPRINEWPALVTAPAQTAFPA